MMIYMFSYLIWDTYAQKWVKTLRLWCLYQNSQLFGCPCLHLGACVLSCFMLTYFQSTCVGDSHASASGKNNMPVSAWSTTDFGR